MKNLTHTPSRTILLANALAPTRHPPGIKRDPPPVRSGIPSIMETHSPSPHPCPLVSPSFLCWLLIAHSCSLLLTVPLRLPDPPSQLSLASPPSVLLVSFPDWAHPPFDGRVYVPAILFLVFLWCHRFVLLVPLILHLFHLQSIITSSVSTLQNRFPTLVVKNIDFDFASLPISSQSLLSDTVSLHRQPPAQPC